MAIIIGAAAAFGLLFLLGVEVLTLLNIFQIILAVLTVLCLLFFVFCLVLLAASKKHPAQLLCIEKQQGKDGKEADDKILSKFAFYQVDGEKLRNWFPAERLGSKRIYGRTECYVRIAKLGGKRLVFDRHSVVIVIAGTVLMGLCCAGFSIYWLYTLGIL